MIDTLLASVNGMLALKALVGLAVGGLLGLVHFGMLWWNTRYFAGGEVLRAFVMQIGRFAVLAVALYGVSRLGALPLLCAALGMLIVRGVILRRVRSMP